MIKEIATFIVNLGLGPPWVRDMSCFVGHVPLEGKANMQVPVRYLVVLETVPGATLGEWPDYSEKIIQLLNREKSYFAARDDAMALYAALHGSSGLQLPIVDGGPQYLACVVDANGTPYPIANPGADGFYIFSTNYVWKIEEASCGA